MRRLKICSLVVFVAFLIPVQFVVAGDAIKGGPLKEKDWMTDAAEAPLNEKRDDAPWIT